jgi:hypothetical protein
MFAVMATDSSNTFIITINKILIFIKPSCQISFYSLCFSKRIEIYNWYSEMHAWNNITVAKQNNLITYSEPGLALGAQSNS